MVSAIKSPKENIKEINTIKFKPPVNNNGGEEQQTKKKRKKKNLMFQNTVGHMGCRDIGVRIVRTKQKVIKMLSCLKIESVVVSFSV